MQLAGNYGASIGGVELIAKGTSDIGLVRKNNEDAFFIDTNRVGKLSNLLIVADGMGGHNCGEVASSKAIDSFVDNIRKSSETDILDTLTSSTLVANNSVYNLSLEDNKYTGMGTTFTVCSVLDGKGYVSHVGDSRLYIINKDGIKQITTDHTYVNEMLKAGEITKEEARIHPRRNVLTKALGVTDYLEIDGFIFEIDEDDIILMCSDGLNNMVRDEEIYDIVNSSSDLLENVEKLISTANDNGGVDNITVILARVGR